MVFKCEENSFLKQFVTKVVSCELATLNWTPPNESKPKEIRGFNVICEDTILFPEGGGQPCDHGSINGFPVRSVVRKDNEAVHFVETDVDFEIGTEVKQCLDWDRRLVHMQHHSGQHLITALFSDELSYETTAWWLGSDTAHVELDTAHLISRESLDLIERKANDLIREGRDVTIQLVDPDDRSLESARIRGLPKNHTGLIRIVNIEGIEKNACCGTHVTNLTQLQCIKILYAEKTKNGIHVHFLVGERVLRRLGECFQREQQLNLTLKGGPAQHVELIQKLQANLKNSTKAFEKLLKDIAIAEADKVENMQPKPKFYCLHRKDGIEPNFINIFLRNAPENVFYFVTVAENITSGIPKGHMVLRGDPALVQKFGPIFIDLLDGKGNGKDENFQGKISNTNKIGTCDFMLEEYFKAPPAPKA